MESQSLDVAAQAESRRRRLLQFLESTEPVWRDEDHPELANGSAAWVKTMRKEGSHRVTLNPTAHPPSHPFI